MLPVKAASAGADGGTNVPTHGRPPARAGMRGSPDSGVLASLSAGWSAARRASAASRARGAALASPFQAGSLSILDVSRRISGRVSPRCVAWAADGLRCAGALRCAGLRCGGARGRRRRRRCAGAAFVART